MTLHERVAQALGWTVEQARSFSLPALRDLVRPVSPKLAEELSDTIRRGALVMLDEISWKVTPPRPRGRERHRPSKRRAMPRQA